MNLTLGILTLISFLGGHAEEGSQDELIAIYEKSWESLAQKETPEWYQDAVLGIYFHWGPYSVPAFGCWGPRNMYLKRGGGSDQWGHIPDGYRNTYQYVKKNYGKPGVEFGYKDFIPMFKAEKWDPAEWAALFKESGADFAGPVAIHHDGFAMWESEYAEYNSMDMGPRRDITGEMLEAVRAEGLKTFVSFHQYTNWFFFNPGRKLCPPGVDVNDPKYVGLYNEVREYKGDWLEYPFSEKFQRNWTDRVIEVIDNYQPEHIWFEIGFSDEDCIGDDYVRETLAHYFNAAESWDQEVVVTRKEDDIPLSCSVLNLEAHSLDEPSEVVWQTDIALGTNHAWAYSHDAVCRPINNIIDEIIFRKSMNGVTLLSLAPLADGTLPPSQVEGMKELGKWMAINKEALYASRPAPFVEGGTDEWKAGTLRFTEKDQYLYAIDIGNDMGEEEDVSGDYPESTPPHVPMRIPGVIPVEGSEVFMLGSDEALKWRVEGQDLIVETLPDPLPCDHAWSFKIQVRE